MSDWKRSTRDCSVDGLPPEMAAAVDKHIELNNLGAIQTQVSACVVTTSQKIKKNLFGPGDNTSVVGALVASGWLLWAARGEEPEVAVMSARLADITVQDYAATPLARMMPDTGVEVTGSFTDDYESASAFIPLDDSPAGQNFKTALIKAVQDVKK